MRKLTDTLIASPTDMANFLACHHKTFLDREVAFGRLEKPYWTDPLAEVLRQRGEEHERRHIESLRQAGLTIRDLREVVSDNAGDMLTAAMQAGIDVVVQPPLAGPHWSGRADILRKVRSASDFGPWSYEVHDTKLSRETRGGTILQLCVYTELLGELQGQTPESFHVVTPDGVESYRFDEFAAYYRLIRGAFRQFLESVGTPTYPDQVEHCDVCRWWERCNTRRRADDHLCFVAGIRRVQETVLERHEVSTLSRLARLAMPLPFTPERGATESYERLHDQASLQIRQRDAGEPICRLLPPEAGQGLARLPEPNPHDLFLDLEGDPFARDGGREYLFGLGRVDTEGTFQYRARWAFDDMKERAGFEETFDDMMEALRKYPGAHVYHYGHYEPTAFKRLMGRYATRQPAMDELLRGERFVDLFAVVRQALIAGVERYSIKNLEPFYGFEREVPLDQAGDNRRLLEVALELGDVSGVAAEILDAVEGYNRDDCRSTRDLRDWLERLRAEAIDGGATISRPQPKPGEATPELTAREQQVEELRQRLLEGVPASRHERTPAQQGRFVLAYLLDWHRREEKSEWWEYYRLRSLPDDELLDEPAAVAGLQFIKEVSKIKKSLVHRYRFPPQDLEIRKGQELKTAGEARKFADIVSVDRAHRTLDLLVGPSKASWRPTALFAHTHIGSTVLQDAVFSVAQAFASGHSDPVASALLDLQPPRTSTEPFDARPGESAVDRAVRLVCDLDHSVLPVQGPPGTGKTFSGARMICALARQGKKVGVTGPSHKVIRNLLNAVANEAQASGTGLQIVQKVDKDEIGGAAPGLVEVESNEQVAGYLRAVGGVVVGGTAWLWARSQFAKSVDTLFIDEAGQMSLANAVAVTPAADNLVLLGDPQQLDQPQKGTHPEGAEASALEHVLGGLEVMPPDRGLFFPETWRLAPAICRFTSEVFYEGQLRSKPGLEYQRLDGTDGFDGAGLWLVEAGHEGNRNASDEEVAAIVALVDRILRPGAQWIDERGTAKALIATDLRIVAPYNAHVARLGDRLSARGIPIGTVDKFQGQEAPVSIYSMATSSPEEAPRGMEFLYSLNRLNVATSRARCAAILVASPSLFTPECQTPHQMRLANALCRFRELATVVTMEAAVSY